MAGSARVPATEITGVYGGLLKMAMRKMIGRVPESAAIMWHHPRVFKDLMGCGRKTEKWDQVEPDLAAYAVMAAAAHLGCSFCLDFNYLMAHHRGLDERKAREVPRWRESEVFTPRERTGDRVRRGDERDALTVTDEPRQRGLGDHLGRATGRERFACSRRA
ncbi:MAG: carboxymuconolactone decarboxylase family protein [Nocardioides sp.]